MELYIKISDSIVSAAVCRVHNIVTAVVPAKEELNNVKPSPLRIIRLTKSDETTITGTPARRMKERKTHDTAISHMAC